MLSLLADLGINELYTWIIRSERLGSQMILGKGTGDSELAFGEARSTRALASK
jgi:hypothetical protein